MNIRNVHIPLIVYVLVFLLILILITSGWDLYLARVAKVIDSDVKSVFASFGFLGNPLGYLIVSATGALVFLYIVKIETAWRYCLFFFFAVAGSGIIADIIKIIFWRARPWALPDHGFHGFFYFSTSGSLSFPSGHAAVAAAVAASLAVLAPRTTPIVIFIPLSVGLSRLIEGAHYLSDVVVGLSIGTLFTLAVRAACLRRGWLY